MQAHIVPRFHLGRFAEPPGRDGYVHLIEKGGRNQRVPVRRASTATDFYVFEDREGNPSAVLEDALQKVESYSARRIERLVSSGEKPTDDDRFSLAYYLVLTNMRTPRMREHLRWMSETMTLAQLRASLEADPPWQRMRKAVLAHLSDEEAEAFRKTAIAMLDSGDLRPEFSESYYKLLAMRDLADQAYVAAEMSWQVMRAPVGEEFVIGDHAVTMYDPTIDEQDGPVGNAIASSPAAETVLPLDRRVAVRLRFDPDDPWVDEEVSAQTVREMNLRSWAWSEQEIYGSSQSRVVAVRVMAREASADVARLRPRPSGFVVENEYPKVGGGYRRDVVAYRREGHRRPRGR